MWGGGPFLLAGGHFCRFRGILSPIVFVFAGFPPLLHQVANNFWSSRALVLRGELEEGRLSRAEEFSEFLARALKSGRANAGLDAEAVFFRLSCGG